MRATLVAAAFLLIVAGAASAAFMLEQPLPRGLKLGSTTGGEITYSIYENGDNILYGGATTFGSTSMWSFWIDGNIFISDGNAPDPNPSYMPDPYNGTQTWSMMGLDFRLNSTLVTGANPSQAGSSLLVMTVTNRDTAAHDFAFRYQWDTLLSGGSTPDGPEILIDHPSAPGDDPATEHCYSQEEADWALPEFGHVKALRTCTGPDDFADTKAYLVWDEERGGTTPDRFTVASWGAAVSSANHWHFQTGASTALQYDNALITWWGYYDPYTLEPDQSRDFVFWYGRGMPPALPSFFVSAFWTDRAEVAPPEDAEQGLVDASRVRFVEEGATTFYPLRVVNNGFDANTPDQPTAFKIEVDRYVPPGWSVDLVEKDSQVPVESLSLLPEESKDMRLKVVAPPGCAEEDADQLACAMGNDAARANITISYLKEPDGYFNKKTSRLSQTLFTTTIVKARYGIELTSEEKTEEIHPGEEATWKLWAKNTGNLREPITAEMALTTLLNPGWDAQFEPARTLLPTGATRQVNLTLAVPVSEPGGSHVLTAKSSVASKTDFDTAEVGLVVLAERNIRLSTPEPQKIVPPGGTVLFPIDVTNDGVQPVPLELNLTLEQPAFDAGWRVDLKRPGFPAVLAPGRSAAVTVALSAPADILAGERASLLLAAEAADGSEVLNTLGLSGVAGAQPSTELAAQGGALRGVPGGEVVVQISATNIGNRDDVLRLLPAALPAGWTATIEPSSLQLPPGASGTYLVRLQLPSDARAGLTDVGLRVVDRDSLTQQAIVRTIDVAVVRGAELALEESVLRVLPHHQVSVLARVTNTGNARDTLDLTGPVRDWAPTGAPPLPLVVEAGESAWVRIKLTAPGDIQSYTLPMTLMSSSGEAFPAGQKGTLTVHVSRPDLVVQGVEVNGGSDDPIKANTLVTVNARVINTGEIGARNFSVQLIVDGEPTDSVYSIEFLDAAGAGRTSQAVATLTWVANEPGPHDVAVLADAAEEVQEERRDNNQQNLQLEVLPAAADVHRLDRFDSVGNAKDAPAPAWLLLAALGCVAWAVRRK